MTQKELAEINKGNVWKLVAPVDTPESVAAGDGSLDPLDGRMRFKHNPAHACGTCADCGGEMVWNVPRMGPSGGFVHKATGRYECNSPIGGDEPHREARKVNNGGIP